MKVEILLDKRNPLPSGAADALRVELQKRLSKRFDQDVEVQVRMASANNMTVLGGKKGDKDIVTEILQEAWESADDWFDSKS
ncbi:DinI-like family protein [Laribacter hongkongensis]|uniref:DinI-like family protein n=1 Tax=Laribacter hongkongensis TaxID=168471 RepID=UPI001EFC96C3|nr:DinI-like family protein [Laribacter hongkongensis]MCG8998424.1 DinI-like family protein [Laribacter hongkongensis]MCG9013593.1 DinI-like family protein [Laribacter hongkongensis]MCG9045105.1 DinI-like family protein [Laribacter hongkongensis]